MAILREEPQTKNDQQGPAHQEPGKTFHKFKILFE